ncbi:MAG: outer membrane lipoprotein chaperone LolA, partial [Luteimonas sp.]|nr:outer membrane lipoprotein chaperone LolA [Luteimonas sp.]
MTRYLRWLALLLTLTTFVALAGARDDLAAFTANLKGLDGQFTQTVFDANGKLKETSSGRVALSAPRLFRWEYVKPYEQLIVADGEKVWVYDPDLS